MSVVRFLENPELSYSLALKKIEEQDYLFAIRLLKDAIKQSPQIKYYVELAELYYKLFQYDESTATYVKAFQKCPSMEIALGLLHSHQAGLGTDLNPDNLRVSSGCFFKMSRNHVSNPKLDNILKKYQKIALKTEEPKLIDVRKKRNLNKLQSAKNSALKGDYSKAMIILDEVTGEEYKNMVLELKTIIYFGAEDFEKVLEVGYEYNKHTKANPTIIRSILYAIYAIANKTITPDFMSAFNTFTDEMVEHGNSNGLIGIYELAQMVGYHEGVEKLIKVMGKAYPYDLATNLTLVAYYGIKGDVRETEKALKIANELFSDSPGISYYNALFNERENPFLPKESWYGLVDDVLTEQYVKLITLNYLRKLSEKEGFFSADVFKIAITFLGKKGLREFLSIKEIQELQEYNKMLIWGIENSYLGIENKTLLVELYISKNPNSDRIFTIPTELGVACTRITGYRADSDETSLSSVYNEAYSNLLFTEQDLDARELFKETQKLFPLKESLNKSLLSALAHVLYYKAKKYEPQTELVANAYEVSFEELLRALALYE